MMDEVFYFLDNVGLLYGQTPVPVAKHPIPWNGV